MLRSILHCDEVKKAGKLKRFVKDCCQLQKVLYPLICNACETESIDRPEAVICHRCQIDLPYRSDLTIGCFDPIFDGRVAIKHQASLLDFGIGEEVQNLLHKLKYKGKKQIGEYLGEMMGIMMEESMFFYDVDYLLPIPLHPAKLRRRGYNQAEVFAKGISKRTNIEILNGVVVKTKDTKSQTTMSKTERMRNVMETYELRSQPYLTGKHILIVDDVITTGATIEACARLLAKIDGVTLSVCTLANANQII